MKKLCLCLVALMPVVLFGARACAADSQERSTTANDWRYLRFEGRWWYWMPSNKWMYWTGARWVPYEISSSHAYTNPNGSYEGETSGVLVERSYSAAPSVNARYRPRDNRSYSGESGILNIGSGYSGYGWSWGPGTARGRQN